MISAFLGVFLSLTPKSVEADTYNYGEFNPTGYYTLDGAVFYAVKIKEVIGGDDYWPSYETVTEGTGANERPVFIKFGETVILEEDESILISFSRQTESDSDDNVYIKNGEANISINTDFTEGTVKINGVEMSDTESNNISSGGEQYYEFGYIIDLNEKVELDEGSLGVASGESNEGLIEFFTDFALPEHQRIFSFMFYAFKHKTYFRTETINNNSSKHFSRPEPALKSGEFLLEHVTDDATKEQYFSEAYFYYEDQNIPYLEFDYKKYEVDITKTIHTTTTTYKLDYNNLHGKSILAPDVQNFWTKNIYAQDLIIEHIEDSTRVKVYFSDLGVYDFTYTAVYYNPEKVYLETINDEYGGRKDRMTVFGTQATYQKIVGESTEAAPFRDIIENLSADVTGEGCGLDEIDDSFKLDVPENFIIASTNQPQVSFLFNSNVIETEVYYAETLEGVFGLEETYTHTDNFTRPGFYYIEIKNKYETYRVWNGTSAVPPSPSQSIKSQTYLFQIKDKSPKLEINALEEGDTIESEIYSGSYVKNGVQIFETERASVFDSPTRLKLNYKEFNSAQMTEITLPTASVDNLTQSQINYLASYGIEKLKDTGGREYYILKKDGNYSVRLEYGRSSSHGRSFSIDNEEISGIKVYNVAQGSGNYYSSKLLAEQGTFALTNQAVSLFWNKKNSGASISASYVRFELKSNEYSKDAADYILNDSWLATDYGILLSEVKRTSYNKASEISTITSNSVLSLSGLYIFKLEDDAGNTAFYSVLIDTSIPTVLQKGNEDDGYRKVVGNNNVSDDLTIFFGTHKAIVLFVLDEYGDVERFGNDNDKVEEWTSKTGDSVKYLQELIENTPTFGASDYVRQDSNNNWFITVPITRVMLDIVNGATTDISENDLNNGYTALEILKDANDRIIDKIYYYHIYDKSNTTQERTSRSYSIRVNTDKTGIDIFDQKGNSIEFYASQLLEDEKNINKIYRPTNADKLYLTWENLHHEDTMGAFVDLDNNGLTCLFYELVWDGYTYRYSEDGVPKPLNFSNVSPEDQFDGSSVEIEINFISGTIQAGKYEIKRVYSPVGNDELGDLGNDYEEMTITFFVDRNPIISYPSVDDEQFGNYSFLTLFDGGERENKVFYNALYQQQSGSFSLQTNKLPIGIYIPNAKYGLFKDDLNEKLKLADIQDKIRDGSTNYSFLDAVLFEDLQVVGDENSTYSPFELYVVLTSPSAMKDEFNGIYYYYTYNNVNGYFMLEGYSKGKANYARDNIISISNIKSFIDRNPLTNSTEYETGTYKLSINTMRTMQEDNSNVDNKDYLQTHNFLFNVSDMTPGASLEAQYPTLNNMQPKEVAEEDGIFYTNTDKIEVSWQELSDDYLTKVDTSEVKYIYYSGSRIMDSPIASVHESDRERSFIIENIPEETTKVEIVLIYETYSKDIMNAYRKYYSKNNDGTFRYEAKIIVMIDRDAPVDSIANLISKDETVRGLDPNNLRATLNSSGVYLDTRFNKTITTGIYRHYSFMASKEFIKELYESLDSNDATETKYFYYRYFPDKYTESIINETGLALDPSASSANVFIEANATVLGWKKITEDTEAIDEDYLDNNFQEEGYYEIIELDLAGNMTVYTIYISNSKELNINFTQNLSINSTPGSLKIEKIFDNETRIQATLTQNGLVPTITIMYDPNPIEINSFDSFNFSGFNFSSYEYDHNSNQKENSYKYIKFLIDGATYLITPYNYSNVEIGDDTVYIAVSAVRISGSAAGSTVALSELKLSAKPNSDAYAVRVYDTVNNSVHNLSIKTPKMDDEINYEFRIDVLDGENIALIIEETANSALKLDLDTLFAYKYKSHNNSMTKYTLDSEDVLNIKGDPDFSNDEAEGIKVKKQTSAAGLITYYFYISYDEYFDSSIFYFAFKDDFKNEYIIPIEYKKSAFGDRYEYNGNDLTNEMQQANNILVSNDIDVNFSNLDTIKIYAQINGGLQEINALVDGLAEQNTIEKSFKKYTLNALNTAKYSYTPIGGYDGGVVLYRIERSSTFPASIVTDLRWEDFTSISDDYSISETIYIKIYNLLPKITATGKDGTDITNGLFNEEIKQSEPVTLSFSGSNDISENNDVYSRVYLRLRGSEAGYHQITSPTTVSAPGIYDVYVQNFKTDGTPLDAIHFEDFVISSLDVIFYTVVKNNSEGNQEIVDPTGKVFGYQSGGITHYIPYHYIVNTSNWSIEHRSNVNISHENTIGTTEIWRIKSVSGTVFETKIAVTLIPATDKILEEDEFMWYYGTELNTSVTQENYISSTSKNIFLFNDDEYDEISLRWKSYYSNSYNKIVCYISSDDGNSWHTVPASNSEFTTIILKKSAVYTFKFVDYAGNTQTFSSASGYPSTTTKVTFIRSVIYRLNQENPLDNAIYNGDVVINLPINTSMYYSGTPRLYVSLNNGQEFVKSPDRYGNYIFSEPGAYIVYFSVKVKGLGGEERELNEDKLTFTIINKNDSRWAFNYVNYNNYRINYIRYNGVNISNALRTYAMPDNSEINISAFLQDSLGNKYFNNGLYTIKITTIDEALGEQSFEFDFWLNDAKPPISVSIAEGESTTEPIKVSFNAENLYETLGDCYVMVNNERIAEITADSTGIRNYSLLAVSPYYIQVYTNSGKLAYSYRVEVTEPLNTITIILIVVSVAVVIGGVILFILLRKKMKIR